MDQLRDLRDEDGGSKVVESPSSRCDPRRHPLQLLFFMLQTYRSSPSHSLLSPRSPCTAPAPRCPLSSHTWLLAPSHLLVWSHVSLSLSSLPTDQQRPLWSHCVPAPCLAPSSPMAQSLSAHLLVVRTCPSGGPSSVWFMAVDCGSGTEQALSKRVRGSRGCLGGK